MIKVTQMFGDEEREVLVSLSMNSAYSKKYRKSLTVMLIVLAVIAAVLAALQRDVFWVVITVVCLLAVIWGVRPYQKWALRRALNRTDARLSSGERSYEIDENGVAINSELGHGFHEWAAFNGCGRAGHYVVLQMIDNRVVLIDESKLTEDEKAELEGYLSTLPEL